MVQTASWQWLKSKRMTGSPHIAQTAGARIVAKQWRLH
jgi:hypothetical protein